MARRKKLTNTLETAPEGTPVLDKYNLDVGEHVRFRKFDKQSWIEGFVHGDYRDGSVTIFADGMMRAVMPEQIQIKTKGPRGGTTWKNLTDA